jgi:U3 small nucleolar ribonucleoprotein protein IMP3
MRVLHHHEQRLLKKVDFNTYKKENSHRENTVMRTYHIQKRQHYLQYNILAGQIIKISTKISLLDQKDEFRQKKTDALVDKCYRLGIITSKSFSSCAKVTVSAFCRRRLAVVMTRLKMSETIKMGVRLIEQGHIRVGPNVVVFFLFMAE